MNDGHPAMRAATSDEGADARGALTRALASETRNALARIELAASEIGRFAGARSLGLRVDTIHSAVAEIDGLLQKLDVVSGLCADRPAAECRLHDVLRGVVARVVPVMRTRGLLLEWHESETPAGTETVALSAAATESILFGLLGVVANACETPGLLELSVLREGAFVGLVLSPPDGAMGVRLSSRAEALQLELDVELAEWAGRSEIDLATRRLAVWLPAGDAADARVGE